MIKCSIRRLLTVVLATLLPCITLVIAGGGQYSFLNSGHLDVTPDNFKPKEVFDAYDVLGLPKVTNNMQAYISSLVYERRYKKALGVLNDNDNKDLERILQLVKDARDKIFPYQVNHSISKTILKAISHYYVWDVVPKILIDMPLKPYDILFVAYINTLDVFKRVDITFTYKRSVKCPHHDTSNRHLCPICKNTGLHVMNNLVAKISIPKGVTDNEMFVAYGMGDYSLHTKTYGDLVVMVKTLDAKKFVRGPVNDEVGSSSDLYTLRDLDDDYDGTTSLELIGPHNNEKITYSYMTPQDSLLHTEIENPDFKDIYDQLKKQYSLENEDFYTTESKYFQCLPNLGLPVRVAPKMRGKLCIIHRSSKSNKQHKYLSSKVEQSVKKSEDHLQRISDNPNHNDTHNSTVSSSEDKKNLASPILSKLKKSTPYTPYMDDDI